MDKKRKRSLSDDGDNPKKKILKIDNVCIENSNYVDSEHSSMVSESRGLGEFLRNRYHDTTDTIGDNLSRDTEGNIIFPGPDGPISVPYLFYTMLWSILRELSNNPRHNGTVTDDESDDSSVDTDPSQALDYDAILQSPYGPITVPRFFHSTLWSMFSELIKSPHRPSTPIGTGSKSLSWDTHCESQPDEHSVVQGDGPGTEPLFCTTLWNMIRGLLRSPHNDDRPIETNSGSISWDTDCESQSDESSITPGEGSVEVPMFLQRSFGELTNNPHLGDTDVIVLTDDEKLVPERVPLTQ